ncbi:class IIb bacteriocin, lactobin A/cerein 7B family [Hymenobacter lutimineralis]|uniref:Class IIb bacteriocin, lactobin A/cerein 7B family n=1 Tax=Hymenobacter lutimineralis TaxID=2606448 RepID=A0A5D6V857_9BACT|nr:class IIb bacteriocin, lactobin A/cerein 7B family [Hymenobacter lutimineralis]TYZ11009.1 class IIb bacteriocin, lactobin A/cerein 7B family [Hymenobacter lutimineralis]
MKNFHLDSFEVVEINTTELTGINGGFWPVVIRIVGGVAAAAGVQILADWDDFKAGLSGSCPN